MTTSGDDDQTKTMVQLAGGRNDAPQAALEAIRHKGERFKVDERQQIKTKKRKSRATSAGTGVMGTMILHFLWSARRSFVLNALLCNATLACFVSFSLTINEATCDDDLMQYQRSNWLDSPQSQQAAPASQQQQQQQQQDSDSMGQQREARQLSWADLLAGSSQSKRQEYTVEGGNYRQVDAAPGVGGELALVSNMLDELTGNQQALGQHQEARGSSDPAAHSSGGEADLLETAQSKAQSNSVSSGGAAATSGSGGDKSTGGETGAPASAPAASSTSGALGDQLSAVSNLIQQAGQLGLTAAQQNVALSEAIINGITNSLVRNTQSRKPGIQTAATVAVAAAPPAPHSNNVGQSLDGNIEYDSNQNTINGNINLPNFNFSNAKPALSAAVRPFLVAALKTVPLKLGTVGWKLLQLLAWKKIYKTHHPKSGEIIIEQEMGGGGGKHGGHSMDKSAKLNKVGDHLTGLGNKLKTSKMGQSYVGGDDWLSMMRSAGAGGGDMFPGGGGGGGWAQASSDSPIASASMLYQRHLLPPGLGASAAAGQPAAAAAAAAAATAAAIQSHWIQQQQQSLLSEEAAAESQQARSNQTSAPGNSASALKRKKASFGGGNWFAATPAQAYVAAAAAANAAASLASHQQQHQQRLAHMMRAYELGGHLDHMQMVATGASLYGAGGGAGAGPYSYPGLFDNAAAMAVQNAVKLPPTDGHHGLATVDFLDQSDSLSGSSFGSPYSSMGHSLNEPPAEPNMGLAMQRRDAGAAVQASGQPVNPLLAPHTPGYRSSTESLLNDYPHIGDHRRAGAYPNDMADFDDTPAGRLLDNALNENAFQRRGLAIHKRR